MASVADAACPAQRDGKEHPYVRAVYDLSKIVFDRSQSPLLMNDFIFYLSPQGRLFRKSSKISKGPLTTQFGR